MTYLAGKKTYILAVLALFYAVTGYFTGNLDAETASQALWAALSLGAVRSAIK